MQRYCKPAAVSPSVFTPQPSIPVSSTSLSSGVSNFTSTPAKPMGLGDIISNVVTAVTGSGRANTTAPVAEEPSLLSNVLSIGGSILTAALPGGPGAAVALGTLADNAPVSSGRAIPLEAEPGLTPAQTLDRAGVVGGRGICAPFRCPPTGKVRRLVRLVGVVNASAILGLPVGITATIAVRPYRRRGITAAALRTTRRTIRAVTSIQHSLSALRSGGCRKTPCRR